MSSQTGYRRTKHPENQTIVQDVNDKAGLLSVNNIEVIYDHVILVLNGLSLEVAKGAS